MNRPSYGHRVLRNVVLSGPSPAQTSSQRSSLKAATRCPTLRIRSSYSPACVPRRQDRGQHGAAQRKAVTVAKLAQAANAGRLAWLLTVQRSSRCADTLTPRRIGVALPRDPGSAEPTSSTCNGRVKRHRDAEDGPIVCNRRELSASSETDPVSTGGFQRSMQHKLSLWRLCCHRLAA